MNPPITKTRFAPSPTGYIHLGNVRTALFSALAAARDCGVFLLRIEDTDQARSSNDYSDALKEDLDWLGLRWQEGPDIGGDHGPYHQSQRSDVYARYYRELEQHDLAYPCFCSEHQLALSRKAQIAASKPPRYAGTCARLTPEQVQAKLREGLQPVLRFRVPQNQSIRFTDAVRGEQVFAGGDIGDFIIRRADGTPAFFFCNAIDDALMQVTHVLRGEDHLSNTPRQILLLEALQLRVPCYGHISMIVGTDGAPLSKRTGSESVRELRAHGYFPLAVVNYLARLGHAYESNAYMTFAELASSFDTSKLGRSPARHDVNQLIHWQREAAAKASEQDLWVWMGPQVHGLVAAGQVSEFIQTVRPNVTQPEDALHWAQVIYGEHLALNHDAQQIVQHAGAQFFEAALSALETHRDNFAALADQVKAVTGVKGKHLFHPLRVALTGEVHGPEMARLLKLLPLEQARRRLLACAGRV
ncbi:MAG: glutamate--tRNA ligase [Gammaproteobacteria bacterium]|nr:glutamate--tRNA ligase [Gammaproteobacteria bacterium]